MARYFPSISINLSVIPLRNPCLNGSIVDVSVSGFSLAGWQCFRDIQAFHVLPRGVGRMRLGAESRETSDEVPPASHRRRSSERTQRCPSSCPSQDVHGLAVRGDDDVPFEPSGAGHTGQDLEPVLLAQGFLSPIQALLLTIKNTLLSRA